jgi:hypothetical protein
MLKMESYPIDTDREQVVRWLMAEQVAGSLLFRLSARQLAEVREIRARGGVATGR